MKTDGRCMRRTRLSISGAASHWWWTISAGPRADADQTDRVLGGLEGETRARTPEHPVRDRIEDLGARVAVGLAATRRSGSAR